MGNVKAYHGSDHVIQNPEYKEQKRAMRKVVKKMISALPYDYRKKADEDICRKVIELPEYEQAEVIFCYVGVENEINTRPILEDILRKGKKLGVPRCISKGVMEVCQIRSFADLQPGKYGILEPKQECPIIRPAEINLGLIPCLTCGRDGTRLGYGGGYYDRYLAQTDCVQAALCREQLIQKKLPMEEHDQKMNIIITETGKMEVSHEKS